VLKWIFVGLIAGFLAKLLMPGTDREPKGCLLTMLLGMAGAIVAGFITSLLFGDRDGVGIIGATLGAMLLIFLMRRYWK
jgi:uncharacterized membrane protein YeaQ/YmgE (transglycosylase-associated protein family)